MSVSETNTPASTSTTATATVNETVTLADEIKKYDTAKLIEFLQEQENLGLNEPAIKILENEEVNGLAFLKVTEEKLRSYGMKGGPASNLADFAKECKNKKLRSYSSYKTLKDLKEVLAKYGIDSNDIKSIPPFKPETVNIDDSDEFFQRCISDIKYRMGNLGPAKSSNEAVRYEYISTILHASIYIVKRITGGKLSLNPQFEVVGEERVDYAIKKIIDALHQELICITEGKQNQEAVGIMQNVMQLESSFHTNKRKRKADEAFKDYFDYLYGIVTTAMDWYFIMYTPGRIYCTKADYHIALTEDVLDDDNDGELRRGVKKVMEVIVGLLKDRVEVDDSPDLKRARTEKFI